MGLGLIEAYIQGFPVVFKSTKDIISCQVTLGQQEKASSCKIELADPLGFYCSELIKHTLSQGGIQALPSSQSSNSGGAGTSVAPGSPLSTPLDVDKLQIGKSPKEEWVRAIVQTALANGVTDKGQIAYMLATAEHESDHFNTMLEYAPGNSYRGGSRYKGRGLVQVTHIDNYEKMSKILKVDGVNNPEIFETNKIALLTIVLGCRDGVFTGVALKDYINGNSRDFYNARRVVNGTDQATLIAGYAEEYYNSIDKYMQQGGASVPQQPKVEPPKDNKPTTTPPGASTTPGQPTTSGTPTTQGTTPGQPTTPTPPASTSVSPPVIKGNKLVIMVAGYTFEYYHQGTETSDDGVTTITGANIAYVLDRRKRSRTESGLSLKELAGKIATAHGVVLDYQADFDPAYEHIDQSGISDYQLLLRECTRNGLFMSDAEGKLTIKALHNIKDTLIVIEPGVNMLTYKIQDKPLDSNSDSESSTLQGQAKFKLDPVTGQFTQDTPQVDPVKDQSASGKQAKDANGKLVPQAAATAQANQGRVKRVKGLPSKFTVPTTEELLAIVPLSAVRTKGLPGVLSRVWMVDKITHQLHEGVTELDLYSPIEAIDSSPPPAAPGQQQPTNIPPGDGFIVPANGVVTGLWHEQRGARLHAGVDIAGAENDPVVASADGVISYIEPVNGYGGGYGQHIDITHAGGIVSRYGHLHSYAAGMANGVQVKQGQHIGGQGNTGASRGVHLHVEWRRDSDFNTNTINPVDLGLKSLSAYNNTVKVGDRK